MMKIQRFLRFGIVAAVLVAMAIPAPAVAQDDDGWQWRGALYLWGADVAGKTRTGTSINVEFKDLVEDLNWGFLGNIAARKGKWLVMTDLVVLDISNTEQTNIQVPVEPPNEPPGIIDVTASGELKLQTWVVNLVGGYNLMQSDSGSVHDVIFGTRFLDLDMDLIFRFQALGQERRRDFTEGGNVFDAIAGVRGNFGLGKRVYIPYYVDIGTGQSRFTWQALGGINIRTVSWLDLALTYRHAEWDFDDDSLIDDMSFSGPLLGLLFHF